MPDDILTRQLESLAPLSILAVGEHACSLISDYARRHPDAEPTRIDTPEQISSLISSPSGRRFDFGIAAGYLEIVDRNTGSALIARLRDVLVRRLCVVVPDSGSASKEEWSESEITAFGLSFLGRIQDPNVACRVYGFDIASYKQTPQWLNPRHWAHPERWNKDRW